MGNFFYKKSFYLLRKKKISTLFGRTQNESRESFVIFTGLLPSLNHYDIRNAMKVIDSRKVFIDVRVIDLLGGFTSVYSALKKKKRLKEQ